MKGLKINRYTSRGNNFCNTPHSQCGSTLEGKNLLSVWQIFFFKGSPLLKDCLIQGSKQKVIQIVPFCKKWRGNMVTLTLLHLERPK